MLTENVKYKSLLIQYIKIEYVPGRTRSCQEPTQILMSFQDGSRSIFVLDFY